MYIANVFLSKRKEILIKYFAKIVCTDNANSINYLCKFNRLVFNIGDIFMKPQPKLKNNVNRGSVVKSKKPPAKTIRKTRMANNDEKVISMVSQGLGHLCFWNIRGSYKPQELRQKAKEHNLPDYVTIPDREIRACLSTACRKFRVVSDDEKPIKAEIVFDDEFGHTIGLLKRDKPEERKAKWEQIDSVYILNLGTSYKVSDSGSTEYAKEFIKVALHELQHHFGNEIRQNIVNPIMSGCKAIPLHAGLRFISKKYEKDLINLQSFLSSVGADFHVLTQLDNEMTRKSIGSQVKQHLTERVAKLQESLKDWEKRSVIRVDAEEALLSELKSINEQADLCKDALQITISDLTNSLLQAKETALQLIDEKPNAKNKEIKSWRSVLCEEYLVSNENNIEVFVVPKTDWDVLSIKFKYRKKDGSLSPSSNAFKILKALGYTGLVKDDCLVVKTIDSEEV